MGLYFLYTLLFILAPLGYGAALAVFLKELHLRQLGTTTEAVITESGPDGGPDIVVPEESETPEPAAEEETESIVEPIAEEQPAVEPPPEVPQDTPDAESDAETEEPEPPPGPPKSVFDDHGLLPKNFKADEVLDDMLDEDRSETPEDLSSRIEAETGDFPRNFEDDREDDFFDFEDDALARAMEIVGGENDNDIDFSGEERHPDVISPSVRDLLGEDFDFDSLTGKPFSEIEVPLRELADGVYRAETEAATQSAPSPELLPEKHEIVSVFPGEMVQNAVIEPDHSEATRQNSFVEETRPMFVRRKK